MSLNILLCGVGGQGTVLASKLLAGAAMKENKRVMSAETIGMAQKGGSVFSYIRIGDDARAPMFGKGEADLIIGFEPAEAVRMLPYLKEDGTVVVNSRAIMPVTAALSSFDYSGEKMVEYLNNSVKNVISIDGESACRELKSSRCLNMVLLGAALYSGAIDLSVDVIKAVMKARVHEQFFELNCRALDYYGNCISNK